MLLIITLALASHQAHGEEGVLLHTFHSMSLEAAGKAAWAAARACRKLGYSVAVAVVDRGGNLQALLRDRYAGPHSIETATRKAWTANSFVKIRTISLPCYRKEKFQIKCNTIRGPC